MCHHDIGFCRAKQTRRAFLAQLRNDNPDDLDAFANDVISKAGTKGNADGACAAEMMRIADAARYHASYIESRDAHEAVKKYPHIAEPLRLLVPKEVA